MCHCLNEMDGWSGGVLSAAAFRENALSCSMQFPSLVHIWVGSGPYSQSYSYFLSPSLSLCPNITEMLLTGTLSLKSINQPLRRFF